MKHRIVFLLTSNDCYNNDYCKGFSVKMQGGLMLENLAGVHCFRSTFPTYCTSGESQLLEKRRVPELNGQILK